MPTAALYDLADALYRLAPWQWMFEHQLIGLRHPVSGELAHISIMGARGDHLSLALYLGADSLHRFNYLQHELLADEELPQEDGIALVLESRQLQVSFDGRAALSKRGLAEIKHLGRKYRGGNYPQFRSFHPGRCPTSLSELDAEWLLHALTQILAVAPTLKRHPDGHQRQGDRFIETLTREFHDDAWRTTWVLADTRRFDFPTPAPDAALVARVARHPSRPVVECQFQLIPSPVGRTPETSVFPYIALSVDRDSGFIFGLEMLSMEHQSHEAMLASVPDCFLRQWDKNALCPASLHVATLATHAMLGPTATALGIPLVLKTKLPALQAALGSAMGFLMGGR